MNICVYGASSNLIDKSFKDASKKLGYEIAKRGHTLIFGAGAEGVMGASAKGAAEAGGKIVGIAPAFFNVDGMIFEGCTELIRPETMRDRKKMLEDKSDAFIMAPGGIGTFDEFFEILTLKQLSRHTKAIAIYNVNNYFGDLLNLMKRAIEDEFVKEECLELYEVFEDSSELLDYLESYKAVDLDILKFKNV